MISHIYEVTQVNTAVSTSKYEVLRIYFVVSTRRYTVNTGLDGGGTAVVLLLFTEFATD